MNHRKQVARAIMEARTKAGLSQTRLARLMGVGQPEVSCWEDGTHSPRIDSLVRIAEACGKTLRVEFVDP